MSHRSKPGIDSGDDNRSSSQSSKGSKEGRKEVDYYLNPTELFRWINYRRWDGAKARVLSHPDECSTWIVSRHSSDGRILWRHLPLHLVCMQSESSTGADASTKPTQIEELIDVLLEAYPQGANSPDDQGMLPLHLAVANTAHPNERVLNLLLMAYPTGVDVKDNHGRTPVDLLNEKAEAGPHLDAALRAMARAQHTTARIIKSIRDENASAVSSVQQTANNERMALQRIIMRLEEELAAVRSQMEEMEHHSQNKQGNLNDLNQEIKSLSERVRQAENLTDSTRRERDDLINQNEILRDQVQQQEKNFKKMEQALEEDQQDQADTIAKYKSDMQTSKAMAEALEAQLRSRFTNEEYLTNTVSDLETKLADLQLEYQQERKKLTNERDEYEKENTQLARSNEDLSKKNGTLQKKMTELNKQLSSILSSHGALNAEHDRVMEASLRMESELIESMRNERTQVLDTMQKQWEFMNEIMKDQEKLSQEYQKKEMELLELAKEDRDRSIEVITKMRKDFRDARTNALERQRQLQAEKIVGSASISSSRSTRTPNSMQRPSQENMHTKEKDERESVQENNFRLPSSSSRASERNRKSIQSSNKSLQSTSSQRTRRTVVSRAQERQDQETFPIARNDQEMQVPVQTVHSSDSSSAMSSKKNIRETSQQPISSSNQVYSSIHAQQERDGRLQDRESVNSKNENLLSLLEERANQGFAQTQGGSNEASSTYSSSAHTSSSGLTSSLRRGVTVLSTNSTQQTPRMVNISHNGQRSVNFSTTESSPPGASSQNSKSSSRVSKSSRLSKSSRASRTSADERGFATEHGRLPSLDEYSVSTGRSESMVDDSETDSSSGVVETTIPKIQSIGSQYSGMSAGLKMGMIRIAEERSEEESEYSRDSGRDSSVGDFY